MCNASEKRLLDSAEQSMVELESQLLSSKEEEASGTDVDHKAANKLKLEHYLSLVVLSISVWSVKNLWESVSDEAFTLEDASRWDAILFVFSSAWVSAVCSGFGVVPFLFVSHLSDWAIGASNAIAAGVMIAASIGLFAESVLFTSSPDGASPICLASLGAWGGVILVKAPEYVLEHVEISELAQEKKKDLSRVLVIMTAMTVHAFSEGVGIGVSHRSQSLGGVVSTSLAIHNIPEGLACAIVLIPLGFSRLSTMLWCIFSSLPQPLLAVPAYLFVDVFQSVTPLGCAFAAGAMCYVSFTELLPEAQGKMSFWRANAIALLSMSLMCAAQVMVHVNSGAE